MGKIFYITRFALDGKEGGSSRTRQVLELLAGHETKVIRIDGTIQAIPNLLKNLCLPPLCSPGLFLWARGYRRHVFQLRCGARLALKQNPDLPDAGLVLLEDPAYFPSLPSYLKKHRIPWISVVHNLESLAPARAARGKLWKLLARETDALRGSGFSLCLGDEEAFLLSNLGIKTRVLPYYPASEKFASLLRIRAQRKTTKPEGFLMLGSAQNPPTRDGMCRVIAEWESRGLYKKFGVLQVAGQDSKHLPHAEGVEILGRLSDEDLDRRLVRMRAAICFQEQGAGQLTRIMDFLVAGVPVVANRHAARSYHCVSGLHQFEDLNGLPQALDELMRQPALLPPPPAAPDTSAVLKALHSLLRTAPEAT